LKEALTSLNPRREIPIALSTVFMDTPEHGLVLTSSVRVANEWLSYGPVKGKATAAVELVGVVVNDQGKPVGSFQTRLNISAIDGDSENQKSSGTIYNSRLPLHPGLYQVRVATRDTNSGQMGSAQEWIEIPDLKSRRLTLSSLLLDVQNVAAAATPQVQFSIDHRFARNSRLTFMAFIYNARSPSSLSIQARLWRRGRVVETGPQHKVEPGSQDLVRIPCGGELYLNSLPAGDYVLEVTVTDATTQTSTSQRTRITVDQGD
jgi:hypothetical protein